MSHPQSSVIPLVDTGYLTDPDDADLVPTLALVVGEPTVRWLLDD